MAPAEWIKMLKQTMAAALAVGAFGIGLLTIEARAADPGYCDRYARSAVAQFERNRQIPGCFHGADARWSPNFDAHFGWCVRAPFGAAEAEKASRTGRLRQCMFAANGHY